MHPIMASFMEDPVYVANQEIKIQVVQDGKVIIEPDDPETIGHEINEMVAARIGSYPSMDSECLRIAKFIVSVEGKSASEIREAYGKLVTDEATKKDPEDGYYLKTGFYMFVREETYELSQEIYSKEDLELYDEIGLTNEWRQNTEALMKLLNIEFQLVLDDVNLPLTI